MLRMGNKRHWLPIDTRIGNAEGTVTICYLDWFHLCILFVCKMYILFLLSAAFDCLCSQYFYKEKSFQLGGEK